MTSTCWQITFYPKDQSNELLEQFLDEFFEVNAQNYSDDGQDEYIGYHSGYFDEHTMINMASAMNVNLPPYKITELKSENWLKDYVIKFDAFEVADFCIYGIHQNQKPETNKILLQISL